jgi:uncharacterized membrane protein YjjP (DUF1212 family)
MNYYKLLNVITSIGFSLISSGAETYRVEESIERMLSAYDLAEVDVFVIPNCIIITIRLQDNTSITKTKRVKARTINLDKIDLLNDLVRSICIKKPDIATIEKSIENIHQIEKKSPIKQIIGHGLVAFGFTLMFGGTYEDALCAILIGPLIYFVMYGAAKFQVNSIFKTMVASSVTAIIALLFLRIGVGDNLDKIIIGAFMNLVPGVLMTNGIRDIIVGDFVSGQVRLTEAVLIATAMAVGAGIVLSVYMAI